MLLNIPAVGLLVVIQAERHSSILKFRLLVVTNGLVMLSLFHEEEACWMMVCGTPFGPRGGQNIFYKKILNEQMSIRLLRLNRYSCAIKMSNYALGTKSH